MQTIVNIWNVWPSLKTEVLSEPLNTFLYVLVKKWVFFFSFLFGFCFVFLLVWSDCLKEIRASKENWFIRLICKLVDNLSMSCRYADFRLSFKTKPVMFLVNLPPPPSPPPPRKKCVVWKVSVQVVVICSYCNCCLIYNLTFFSIYL